MRKEELERWDDAQLLSYKNTLQHRIACNSEGLCRTTNDDDSLRKGKRQSTGST